ncbi:hypothetical protein NAEGRDRAFT_82643 [Naegleria gruberi]|uniref:RCC1-like domain-containing protein n=1 Tax=Naegleria gruberi TaxID=5762 RepID=D2VIP4_NAEGR|nr:uncharacterized protein NAEGRDRAFT_82643 [Naegleria gruberi]EFC43310.1 hypothetical protein NAEGRDRAFT_82643 [Naegleria gruberi]|eukprot:XP_002676054.1 hypothetical protein NAEGRDRAFT_82643 [Naegleria gruberi strain NEG-M]
MSKVYFWGAIGVKGVQSDEPALLAGGKKSSVTSLKPLLAAAEIVQVSAGGSFCAMLDLEGNVYSFGKGADHRLGLGDERDHFESPAKIPQLKASIVSAGYSHGMALLKDCKNKVVLWGKLSPQLTFMKPTEKVVELQDDDDQIVSLRSGNGYSAVITKKGHVFMIGRNSFYKCGFAENADLDSFKQLVINDNGNKYDTFKDIDLGYDSTLAITATGEVFGFGSNNCYQLGIGKVIKVGGHVPTRLTFSSPINPVQVACSRGSGHHCHGVVLDADGVLHSFGSGYKYKLGTTTTDDQPVPVKVDFDIKVKQVIPGGIHNFSLTVDNELVSFGCGSDGRLGHEESKNYRYLYKETEPRKIEGLGNKVVQADSDYYFGIAIVK